MRATRLQACGWSRLMPPTLALAQIERCADVLQIGSTGVASSLVGSHFNANIASTVGRVIVPADHRPDEE